MHVMKSDGLAPQSKFLEGHFPGNPIVPGAVLLGLAQQGLRDSGYEISSIQRVKFLRQLLPGQAFEITVDISDSGGRTAKLSWVSGAVVLADARVELRPVHG